MTPSIAIYRRRERKLPRSGRVVLRVGAEHFDLTEESFRSGSPAQVTTLHARGFFEAERFADWLEDTQLRPAEPITEEDELLSPFLQEEVGKILALGKNFTEHAREFSEEVPAEPLFFDKLPECMAGSGQAVAPPVGYTGRLDHEVELAVLIGQRAHCIEPEEAGEVIAGFTVANDLTLRSLQGADRDLRYPWFRSKNFDGALPLGPCFVPAACLDPGALTLTARVGDQLRQSANTRDLVVDVPTALAYLSRHLTLNPGDLILMGTPAGVGPLEAGDEVVCAISGIGELRTPVRASPG